MATEATPTPERRDPSFIRKVNRVMRPLLRSPLHRLVSKNLMLLTFKGRKTGKQYTLPLSYVQAGNTLWLGTQTPWYKNLRGGMPVSVRVRGKEVAGTANVIDDEEGMREGYRNILTLYPGYSRFVEVTLGEDGQPRHEEVARARQRGYVVIKIDLDGGASSD